MKVLEIVLRMGERTLTLGSSRNRSQHGAMTDPVGYSHSPEACFMDLKLMKNESGARRRSDQFGNHVRRRHATVKLSYQMPYRIQITH